MTKETQERPVAQFYRHRVGEVELIALNDGGINYPGPMIFGKVPPEGVAQYKLPAAQIFIPYTILLIKTQGKLILTDVGAGDLGNRNFPGLDQATTRTNLVVPSLQAAGISPQDIDMVLITHAHPDHIGGLFDPQGNLVFSKAHYYVAQKEWNFWMSTDPSAAGAEALRAHLEMLVRAARTAFNAIEDRMTLVQGDEEMAPGVRFEPAWGHTPGHTMVSISAGEQIVYNISDVVVQPLFVEHPEWSPAIDMDAAAADEARRRLYTRAVEENALVFAHHMGPFPNLGHIIATDTGWEWVPIAASS